MSSSEPLPQLLARLLAEQRARWERGDRFLVETYLHQHPALEGEADAILDLIYNEVFLREQAGETALLAEYVERFPRLSAPLRMQFAVHQAIQAPEASVDGPTGPEVPGYEILGEIGRGGMGVVFKARDRHLGRLAAVKMIRSKHCQAERVRKRFLAEIQTVAVLDHPHLVRVYTAGECATGAYLVMELLDGPSLAALLHKGPLSIPQAVDLMIPVAEAVHHAHTRGVIHRDLKPANVMLDGAGRPRVMDFGLAKAFGNNSVGLSSTQQGMVLGTPSYMPPEQAGKSRVKPGPHNDIYSLGAILYALLTGQPPYQEATLLATLLRVKSEHPPPGVRHPSPGSSPAAGAHLSAMPEQRRQGPSRQRPGPGRRVARLCRVPGGGGRPEGKPRRTRHPTRVLVVGRHRGDHSPDAGNHARGAFRGVRHCLEIPGGLPASLPDYLPGGRGDRGRPRQRTGNARQRRSRNAGPVAGRRPPADRQGRVQGARATTGRVIQRSGVRKESPLARPNHPVSRTSGDIGSPASTTAGTLGIPSSTRPVRKSIQCRPSL